MKTRHVNLKLMVLRNYERTLQRNLLSFTNFLLLLLSLRKRERERERDRERQRQRQTQKDRERDRERQRETERESISGHLIKKDSTF